MANLPSMTRGVKRPRIDETSVPDHMNVSAPRNIPRTSIETGGEFVQPSLSTQYQGIPRHNNMTDCRYNMDGKTLQQPHIWNSTFQQPHVCNDINASNQQSRWPREQYQLHMPSDTPDNPPFRMQQIKQCESTTKAQQTSAIFSDLVQKITTIEQKLYELKEMQEQLIHSQREFQPVKREIL